MRVDLFDFDLPADRIALRPAVPRDAARLLVLPPQGPLRDFHVRDLPDLLSPGDALVLNDTRVVPARLRGVRTRDGVSARIEIMLHQRLSPDRWRAFARPAKRLRIGDEIHFAGPDNGSDWDERLTASVEDVAARGDVGLVFSHLAAQLDAAVAALGEIPLPPYIAGRRSADAQDLADYQTLHARRDGAVAAPTAGLHFTPDLAERLATRGISRHLLTLHVGAGTFLPVAAEDTDEHRMHAEWGEVSPQVATELNAVRARGGAIVAVGTTSLRLLESAADQDGRIRGYGDWTDIFITPGYRFRAVDRLLTNFHLPRSTLTMLVAAFAGLDRIKAAYAHAIASGYRFYSYGDACLLDRQG